MSPLDLILQMFLISIVWLILACAKSNYAPFRFQDIDMRGHYTENMSRKEQQLQDSWFIINLIPQLEFRECHDPGVFQGNQHHGEVEYNC